MCSELHFSLIRPSCPISPLEGTPLEMPAQHRGGAAVMEGLRSDKLIIWC